MYAIFFMHGVRYSGWLEIPVRRVRSLDLSRSSNLWALVIIVCFLSPPSRDTVGRVQRRGEVVGARRCLQTGRTRWIKTWHKF